MPVAVVPFARNVPADAGLDIAAVVQRDLESSGRFRGVERSAMPAQPGRSADVDAASWRATRADYVVVGRVAAASGAQFISTDYPEPRPEFSPYCVTLPGGVVARANPVNGSASTADLER